MTTPTPQLLADAPPRRTLAILAAGLALALAALLAFAYIATNVAAGATQVFDDAVRAGVHEHASVALTPLMRLFTFLGSTPFISVAGIALFIWFWRTGRRHRAWLLALTIIGATILMLALKYGFHRPRPEPFFDTPLPPFDSFPSGHSMVSFCFYAALAALTAANEDSRLKRALIWACCASLVTMIGLSRIYLGVHWPTDVLCAYLAAIVWTVSIAVAYHGWKRQKTKLE